MLQVLDVILIKERAMTKNKVVFLSAVVFFSCGIFAMDESPKKIVVPRRPSIDATPPLLNMTPVDIQRARDANSLPQASQKSPKERVQENLVSKAKSIQERDFTESLSGSK
jgi:hypothetical protein